MARSEIELEGGRELRKALRDFSTDNGWRSPLKEAFQEVGKLVERESRSLAGRALPTIGGSMAPMSSRAIASIRGKGTTTAASLQAFKGAAEGPGQNFGSTGRYRQFPRKQKPDRALYKAVEEKREQITNEFAEAVEYALESAFPE